MFDDILYVPKTGAALYVPYPLMDMGIVQEFIWNPYKEHCESSLSVYCVDKVHDKVVE